MQKVDIEGRPATQSITTRPIRLLLLHSPKSLHAQVGGWTSRAIACLLFDFLSPWTSSFPSRPPRTFFPLPLRRVPRRAGPPPALSLVLARPVPCSVIELRFALIGQTMRRRAHGRQSLRRLKRSLQGVEEPWNSRRESLWTLILVLMLPDSPSSVSSSSSPVHQHQRIYPDVVAVARNAGRFPRANLRRLLASLQIRVR